MYRHHDQPSPAETVWACGTGRANVELCYDELLNATPALSWEVGCRAFSWGLPGWVMPGRAIIPGGVGAAAAACLPELASAASCTMPSTALPLAQLGCST